MVTYISPQIMLTTEFIMVNLLWAFSCFLIGEHQLRPVADVNWVWVEYRDIYLIVRPSVNASTKTADI
jgi:hypothetical protein